MIKIDHNHWGKVLIRDGDTQLCPWVYHLSVFDQVGIVQLDNGRMASEHAKLTHPGDETGWLVGDYEIIVRRVKPKALAHDGIISMKDARRFKKPKE